MPELSAILEALLFAAPTPLSLERLSVLTEAPKAGVRIALETLAAEYDAGGSALFLAEVAGGYQLRTRPEYAPYLRQLKSERGTRLSQAALESLAIVAYRQPVTRAEIEYLRGVDSGGVVKSLLEKNLLRILGKKDVPGRPLMYGTSRHFLEYFGLRDLGDLPTLKEISALDPELPEAEALDPAADESDHG